MKPQEELIIMYGGTKAGEIARSSELLDTLHREHGVYLGKLMKVTVTMVTPIW